MWNKKKTTNQPQGLERLGRIDTGCFKTSTIGNRNHSGVAPGRLWFQARGWPAANILIPTPTSRSLSTPPTYPSRKPALGALLRQQRNRDYRRPLRDLADRKYLLISFTMLSVLYIPTIYPLKPLFRIDGRHTGSGQVNAKYFSEDKF